MNDLPERAQRVKALLQQAVALLEREGELLAAAEIDFPALERSLQQMGAIMQELEACRPCRSAPALAPGEAAPFAVSRDENKLDLDSAEPASPAELSSLAERIIALRRRNMDLLRARMSECAARIKEAARRRLRPNPWKNCAERFYSRQQRPPGTELPPCRQQQS